MKCIRTLVILTLLTGPVCAQIITDKTSYDFGEVKKEDKKYVDFKFTNASKEAIRILNADEPYGIAVKFSNKIIQPDSAVFVRIKYTPKRKGEFRSDIPIRVSSNSQPIVLSVKGKAITFDPAESMDCPDFTDVTRSAGENIPLTITVLDKATGKPIENARIDVIWDGVFYKSFNSGANGKVAKAMKEDMYYLIASAEGYASVETDVEFNESHSELIIELGTGEGEFIAVTQQVEPAPDTSGQALQDEPAQVEEEKVEIAVVDTPAVTEQKEPEIAVTSTDLPENLYASNNIVFLIDISVSMKQGGKLDLLKASMIELTNLLRNSDKVAIVTYASQTNLVLRSMPASNKQEIIDVIKGLEAGGSTSGTKGIKKAYAVLNNNRIEHGNNQVFISTDGAFNLEKRDKKLLKIVKSNAKKGNKISVLGIKNPKWTVQNMMKIASTGQGNYIHIENYEGAKSSLVEEVKKQSIMK